MGTRFAGLKASTKGSEDKLQIPHLDPLAEADDMNAQELQEIKEKLLQMQHDLGKRSEALLEALREEEIPPGEHEQRVAASASAESDRAMEEAEERIGRQIEEALERIDAGDFGACHECGKKISKTRLKAIPYALYCVKCAEKIEQETAR